MTVSTTPIPKEKLFEIISENGIRVDIEGLMRHKSKLQGEEAGILDKLDVETEFERLRKKYPDAFKFTKRDTPRFNPRSKKHLGAWFADRGEDLPHSTSIEALESRLPHSMYELLVKARRLRKNWGDLQTLRDQVQLDGKIHVEWSEATTGRWYTGKPAIQTMSKICRNFLVPELDGQFWIVDWKQQELRILAHLSQEPEMLKWFEDKSDPHIGAYLLVTGRTDMEDFSDPNSAAYRDARDLGKMLNYALIYGLDAQGLGGRLRIPNDKAQLLIDAYFKRLPVLASWREQQKEVVRSTGYVETMGGRLIPVELEDRRDADARIARKAVNYKIQGSAAEQLIEALRYLYDKDILDRVRATIHDALLIETDSENLIAPSVVESMSIPFLGVVNPVEIKGPANTWMEAMDWIDNDLPEVV